ncbi:MAG: hypothetical protein HY329_06430 [Chloroflexi bacterium]|nr:hypothetical protein [Chloroflexota bacterium]
MTAIDLDRELTGLRAEHADLLAKYDYLRRLGHAAGPEFDELLGECEELWLEYDDLYLKIRTNSIVEGEHDALGALEVAHLTKLRSFRAHASDSSGSG